MNTPTHPRSTSIVIQRASLMMRCLKTKSLFQCCLGLSIIVLCVVYLSHSSVSYIVGFIPMDKCPMTPGEKLRDHIDDTLDLWTRDDVQTCTYWRAAVMWEGMFNPEYYDKMHSKNNSAVALTVFAVGRYLDAYLESFLESSEHYFMVGFPVTYYVFTDAPEKVPDIKLAPERNLKIIKVDKHTRWQDISMMRMKTISDIIESDIRHHCSHVFCFDVDQVFAGRFGSEALGDSVALLHAYYYRLPKSLYTYDHNPKSRAYMEPGGGDFYYHAAVFGGSWQNVKSIADACYEGIVEDKQNNVEAMWHDESHLNKYLWLHKPSKVLSPEYCWASEIGHRDDMRITRLLWAEKHYDKLRTS